MTPDEHQPDRDAVTRIVADLLKHDAQTVFRGSFQEYAGNNASRVFIALAGAAATAFSDDEGNPPQPPMQPMVWNRAGERVDIDWAVQHGDDHIKVGVAATRFVCAAGNGDFELAAVLLRSTQGLGDQLRAQFIGSILRACSAKLKQDVQRQLAERARKANLS